jgi:branched-chain amino acid transport system substrate-binding protein
MPVTRKAKMVQMAPCSTAKSITHQGNPWIFRLPNTSEQNMENLVKFYLRETKHRRFGYLVENTDQGIFGMEGFKKALAKHGKDNGAELVAIEYYNLGDTDFNPQLTKFKSINPPIDLIQTVALLNEATLIVKQSFALDYKPVWGFMAGPAHQDFIKFTGKASEGIIYMSDYVASAIGADKFEEGYFALHGKRPDNFSALGYTGMRIVVDAIKRAGTTESASIREAMTKTDYKGFLGRVQFDKNGDGHSGLFVMTIKDGKRIILGRAD